MAKAIIGIDPGLRGAIVSLPEAEISPMPIVSGLIDISEFVAWIRPCIVYDSESIISHVYLEQAQAFPKQGRTSIFTTGRGLGTIEGILAALEIPYTLVNPRKWQHWAHQGIGQKLKPKQRSLIAVKRLFPGVSLLATERSRVPHDGIVDALLIAAYGRAQG